MSFKLNFNETAAARAPPAVRMEIATGGMRGVKDAQTVLLTTDNEIQNANATFTAFLFRFILIIFSHTLSAVFPEMPWLSLYSPGSFNCFIFCRKPLEPGLTLRRFLSTFLSSSALTVIYYIKNILY